MSTARSKTSARRFVAARTSGGRTKSFQPETMQSVVRRRLLDYLHGVEPGWRLPPLLDFAQELGVGQTSLYRVVRELATEGLVYSRPKLGTFVAKQIKSPGKQSQLHATALRAVTEKALVVTNSGALTGRSVAIVAHEYTDELFMSMARVAKSTLRSMGASVYECDMEPKGQLPFNLSEKPDLAILIDPRNFKLVRAADQPHWVVASMSWSQPTVPQTYDLVGLDQCGAAYLAGAHLKKLGFESACYVGRKFKNENVFVPVSAARLVGFERGFGRPVLPEHQIDCGDYAVMAGGRAFREYLALEHRPVAVFAVCDDVAVGFVAAAAAHGWHAGDDYHLVGFDGQKIGKRLEGSVLTTVEVPAEAMGQTAADMAANRLLNPDRAYQTTYLACRLVTGQTARSPKLSPR